MAEGRRRVTGVLPKNSRCNSVQKSSNPDLLRTDGEVMVSWITLKDGLLGHSRARKRRTFIFTGGGYGLCSRPFRITFKISLAEIGPTESTNPT